MKIKSLDGTVELDSIFSKKSVIKQTEEIIEDKSVELIKVNRDYSDIKKKEVKDINNYDMIDFKTMQGKSYIQKGNYFIEK